MSVVYFPELLNREDIDLFSSDLKLIDLKRLFQVMRGITVSNQKIEVSFNLDGLKDDDTCFWNNLVFHVYDISNFPLNINNKFYEQTINVNANYNIQTLKNNIYEKTGIPAERQIFRNKDKILANDIILKDEQLHKINFSIVESTFLYESNLKIKYPDSKIKTIKTDLLKTGIELLQEIENKTYEKESDITYNIIHNEKFLPLSDLLSHCAVKEGDLLELEKRSITFPINIKSLTGKTIKVIVSPKDTSYMVKYFIQLHEGIPIDQIRLIFEGMQMEDHKTIESYGIENESILHMVLRLRG